jgi:uncharacterized phage protein (TIGR01671 family)
MREYLFRGKRIDNGEWVHGCLTQLQQDQVAIYDNRPCASSLRLWEYIQLHTYEVIPETVGQYTGLLDKNGKEIYEGDIVKAWSQGVSAIGEVSRRIDGLWIIYPAYQKQTIWGLMPDKDGTTTVEVIGNIYDNPELVEPNENY